MVGIAGIAENGLKQLEIAGNCWKWPEWLGMAGNGWNGLIDWIWLKIAGNGWNGWKWLERAGTA